MPRQGLPTAEDGVDKKGSDWDSGELGANPSPGPRQQQSRDKPTHAASFG